MTGNWFIDILLYATFFSLFVSVGVYAFLFISSFITDRWYEFQARRRRDREERHEYRAFDEPQKRVVWCEACKNWTVDRSV